MSKLRRFPGGEVKQLDKFGTPVCAEFHAHGIPRESLYYDWCIICGWTEEAHESHQRTEDTLQTRLAQAIRDTGLFPHGIPMSPLDSPLGTPMPIENFAGLLAAALHKQETR